MVKRATIHVSSRTKKNHPKTLRNQGNKKKTTNTTYTRFYNQVTFAGEAGCNIVLAKLLFLVVYLAEGLYTRVACFVLAKLFHFMALFLAMA